MRYTSLLIVAICLCTAQCQRLTDIVSTAKGCVQGKILETVWNSVTYSAFMGIPYAQPPVGDLRFQDPVEIEEWEDTKLVIEQLPPCAQYILSSPYGREDCLYLNVFSPVVDFANVTETGLKPVMVWIFGGGNQVGSANSYVYTPDFFLEEDVLFVSFNYRLGILGYLALKLEEASGNQGLKDQVMALKWVQENIAAFGGDPNQVTIFGESAGGADVGFHMLSKMSEGLFQKAIMQSATPLNPWTYQTPDMALKNAYKLAAEMGIVAFTNEMLLESLKQADVKDILEIASTMINVLLPLPIFMPFVATIETSGSNRTFLNDCPIAKIQAGDFQRVPTMLGYNKNEAIIFAFASHGLTQILENNLLAKMNTWTAFGTIFAEIYNIIREGSTSAMIELASAYYFSGPTDLMQRFLARFNGDIPVYFYHLAYESEYNFHTFFDNNINGTSHGDDLSLMFNFVAKSPANPRDPFNVFRKKIVRLWTNFAKFGNPTPCSKFLNGVTWEPSGKQGFQLEIGNDKFSIVKRVITGVSESIEKAYAATLPLISGCDGGFNIPSIF